MRIAITRALSPRIGNCELSYIEREPIDFARATEQHDVYEQRLVAHGCTIVRAADAPEMPDGVFVEDAAIVLDDIAVIARPGAESRRGETESIARVLGQCRTLKWIEAPGTLDGGDVLATDGALFVGLSARTNEAAIAQIGSREWELGSRASNPAGTSPDHRLPIPVRFRGCLHLKSAVTQVGGQTLLVNPDWVDARQFRGFETIDVDPSEPFAANALNIGDVLIYSASYPRTRRRLEARGFAVDAIDVSELEKAEAGVTCCSIIFES